MFHIYTSYLHRKLPGSYSALSDQNNFLKQLTFPFVLQSSMYLYSLFNQRIEYKIDLKDEQFVSSKVDKFGVFFETRSFKTPRKVYRIDFCQLEYRDPLVMTYTTIKPFLWKESKIPNLDGLEIKIQYDSFYSFDLTEVPMTIIQKENDEDDNCKKPCLVYAYAGYGDCLLPRFDLYFLLFVELFNGIVGSYIQLFLSFSNYPVVNISWRSSINNYFEFFFFKSVFMHIRGGGELGDEWSLKSSNIEISFYDLIVGVEYLKGKSYADIIDSKKIAFHGTSHGGLVGAAAMNLKPNLLRAVTLLNGYFDLINDLLDGDRLHQYGDINNKNSFSTIKRYAPLLHIHSPATSEESYPATLIVASKNDEAVPNTNSLKYLAHRREHAENNEFQEGNPVLLKVINTGGHNYRTATRKDFIDAVFVKLQFLAEAMELKCDAKYRRPSPLFDFLD